MLYFLQVLCHFSIFCLFSDFYNAAVFHVANKKGLWEEGKWSLLNASSGWGTIQVQYQVSGILNKRGLYFSLPTANLKLFSRAYSFLYPSLVSKRMSEVQCHQFHNNKQNPSYKKPGLQKGHTTFPLLPHSSSFFLSLKFGLLKCNLYVVKFTLLRCTDSMSFDKCIKLYNHHHN